MDVQRRERGRSELIIEEFMLMANTAAARLAKESGIPLFTGYTKIRPPKR